MGKFIALMVRLLTPDCPIAFGIGGLKPRGGSSCFVWATADGSGASIDCNSGECGGRADVRWASITSSTGQGIAAVSLDSPMQVNVTR